MGNGAGDVVMRMWTARGGHSSSLVHLHFCKVVLWVKVLWGGIGTRWWS